jgi:hypothetical protein
VFAEQAGLQGAQVRVFIDAKEALAWLYKDSAAAAAAAAELQWPVNPTLPVLPVSRTSRATA